MYEHIICSSCLSFVYIQIYVIILYDVTCILYIYQCNILYADTHQTRKQFVLRLNCIVSVEQYDAQQ